VYHMRYKPAVGNFRLERFAIRLNRSVINRIGKEWSATRR
jgi:hypothetical protein